MNGLWPYVSGGVLLLLGIGFREAAQRLIFDKRNGKPKYLTAEEQRALHAQTAALLEKLVDAEKATVEVLKGLAGQIRDQHLVTLVMAEDAGLKEKIDMLRRVTGGGPAIP